MKTSPILEKLSTLHARRQILNWRSSVNQLRTSSFLGVLLGMAVLGPCALADDYTYTGLSPGTTTVINNTSGTTALGVTDNQTGVAYTTPATTAGTIFYGGTSYTGTGTGLTDVNNGYLNGVGYGATEGAVTLTGGLTFLDALPTQLNGSSNVLTAGGSTFSLAVDTAIATSAGSTNYANLYIKNKISLGTANLSLTGTGQAGQQIELAGTISGTGGLTDNISGSTVILTGTNGGADTYSGATTINAGTLQIGFAGDATGLASSGIAINNNGTTTSGALVFSSTTSFTYAGAISGTGGLTNANTGVTTLSGNNTYTGRTTVTAGTLQAGSATAFGSNSAVTLANTAGAVLALNNNSVSIGSLTGGGTTGGNVTLGSGTLTTGGDNTSPAAYAGVISGTGGLTKTGTGTQTLTGTNTFTGGTTVNAGTLTLNNGGGSGVVQGTVTVNTNAILNLAKGDALGYASGSQVTTLNVAGGNVTSTAGNSEGYLTNFNLTGGTVSAGSLFRFNVNATTTPGITSLASGTTSTFAATIDDFPAAGVGAATGSLGINVAAGTTASGVDLTISGVIGQSSAGSGAAGITKTGAGTLLLSGANTYAGPTTVNAGTLQAGSATAFGSNSAVTLANTAGAVLALNNNSVSIGSLTGGGTTGGNVTLGSGTLTTGGDNTSPAAYAGVISGTGGLTKTGTGTQTLSGANTYTGATTVNAGTLQAGSATAFGSNSAVTLANTAGAVLALNNNSVSIGSLTGGGATGGNVTLGSGTLTTGGDNTSPAAYAGVISGTGGLTKTGTGTQTLTGTNTYAGTTTVSAGTLTVGSTAAAGGTLGSGAVAVNSGGTLTTTGNGTLGTGTSVAVNGTGLLTLGNSVSFNSGQTLTFDESTAISTINLGSSGTNNILANIIDNQNTAYTLAPGTYSASDLNADFTRSGMAAVTTFTGSGTLTEVPEPTTWLGGVMLVGTFGFALRRRTGARLA